MLPDVGRVEILESLNSFYEQPEHKERRMTALHAWLKRYAGQQLLVLVTHQVTISALTSTYASSGEIAVVERLEDGSFRVLGGLVGAQAVFFTKSEAMPAETRNAAPSRVADRRIDGCRIHWRA